MICPVSEQQKQKMILLVASVIVSLLHSFLPSLVEKIVKRLVWIPKSSAAAEMENLRRQMDEIDMKEDFAKYAKLQRQVNKIKDEYKVQARETAKTIWKYGLIARYSVQFIMTITCMVMFWKFRSMPVVILKETWLDPMSGVLSWPTHIPCALSFPVWFLMCSTVVKLISDPHSLRLQ